MNNQLETAYNVTPFIKTLVSLASEDLANDKLQILHQIIDYLLSEMQNGHSCININDFIDNHMPDTSGVEIIRLLKKSNLCGFYTLGQNIELKPLTILNIDKITCLLYITRYFSYELSCVSSIKAINQKTAITNLEVNRYLQPLIENIHDGFPNHEQIEAVKTSALNKLSFITGGPGTGKTTTVLILINILIKIYIEKGSFNLDTDILNIGICAPTGKATNRVKESILLNLSKLATQFNITDSEQVFFDKIKFSTIHKLLGARRNSIYFKHNQENKLDIDILVVDESSMISLALFYKLLIAINENSIKHIIFLGDKNQLSSVEEGYVFASLIEYASHTTHDLFSNNISVSNLIRSNRYFGSVAQLSTAILNNNFAEVVNIFNQNDNTVKLFNNSLTNIFNDIFLSDSPLTEYINYVKEIPILDTANNLSDNTLEQIAIELFNKFKRFAILCSTNVGKSGVINLNAMIEEKFRSSVISNKDLLINDWYNGRPILILENNNDLGLYNGDIGICIIVNNKPLIFFEDGTSFIPEVLPHYQASFAITIHKSQGSEYEHIYIVVDASVKNAQIISKELIYTAVTRAKISVKLYADIDLIKESMRNSSKRISGIEYLALNLL